MNQHRKPRYSLTTILILWFLIISIIPTIFISLYSIKKFQQALDNELVERLKGNVSEIKIIIDDYGKAMMNRRRKYSEDRTLIQALYQQNKNIISEIATDWLNSDVATDMLFYNEKGRLLVHLFKNSKYEVEIKKTDNSQAILLSKSMIADLELNSEVLFIDFSKNKKLQLVALKAVKFAGKTVGFVQQTLGLDNFFLKRIYERMQMYSIVLQPNGRIITGSHSDFELYKDNFFAPNFESYSQSHKLLNLPMRGNLVGFIFTPIKWGDNNFFLVLGASKKEMSQTLDNITKAFYWVVGTLVLILFLMIIFISKSLMRPLYDLLDAIENLHLKDQVIEIPIKSETEIGLLTTSFNEMSRKVIEARNEIKKKVEDLEITNKELIDTQSQLVQSAKLAGLGQLVAGVAHELNNPIAFIYSNMNPLKEYSQSLLDLVDIAEKHPENLLKAKEEKDLDYISKDLPKLIASCEDGARRVKDIVIGLKNFSRTEERTFSRLDLHESIQGALQLLAGELKNKVEVHLNFSDLPLIECNRSQINQVIMNILSNAAQAIKQKGQIWISTSRLKDNKNDIQISIQDSGEGMEQKVLDKIFDPFFTTKEIGHGTGLGLSISYGIIQSHQGSIQVKSKIGEGTEFVITLPINQEKLS